LGAPPGMELMALRACMCSVLADTAWQFSRMFGPINVFTNIAEKFWLCHTLLIFIYSFKNVLYYGKNT
jgi:hypothetical protein